MVTMTGKSAGVAGRKQTDPAARTSERSLAMTELRGKELEDQASRLEFAPRSGREGRRFVRSSWLAHLCHLEVAMVRRFGVAFSVNLST